MVDSTFRKSPTLAMNEAMARLRSQGKTVFSYGFGQSPFPIPEPVVQALKQHAHKKNYLPVQGLAPLRQHIAAFQNNRLQVNFTEADVIIGPGSKEIIWSIIYQFSGDILIPSPSWVTYAPQVKMAKKNVITIPCDATTNWIITADAFERACKKTSNKKLIILNYPNNPTGSIPSIKQAEALVSIAKKYDVIILHDNIYGRLDHSKSDISFSSLFPENTILTSGLSKWCGAGGWRLGFGVFPKPLHPLRDRVLVMASETFSCVSSPIQYAAITAYENKHEVSSYLLKSNKILQSIANYTYKKLNSMGCCVQPSEGGFYFFPIFSDYKDALFRKGILTSTALCKNLLSDTGVALLPGTAFGRPAYELSARLAYVAFDGNKLLELKEEELNAGDELVEKHCPQIIKGLLHLHTWLENI